jgi:hypothetical protein
MSNSNASIVPRHRRDEVPPSAPLDPYVTELVRWIAERDKPVNPNSLAKQAAAAFDWPPPFAEAVLIATRARRLLTLLQATSRGESVGLSRRGRQWLEHEENRSAESA